MIPYAVASCADFVVVRLYPEDHKPLFLTLSLEEAEALILRLEGARHDAVDFARRRRANLEARP